MSREHALFLLFFARFRSEVIEMKGGGWNLQHKETYLNNNEETRFQNLKKKILSFHFLW